MDWTHKYLITTDFREVDEPLFTAATTLGLEWIEDGRRMREYAHDVIHKIKLCNHLHLKRFLWIVIMMVCPPIQEHIAKTCWKGEHYGRWWIKYVNEETKNFLLGEYTDVSQFMTHVCESYVTGSFVEHIITE
jgi:hypothetical protein